MAGLPDYSKLTAANLGALIGVLLFASRRLISFRPAWFDIPALLLCLIPAASFAANGLPSWPAVTAVSVVVLTWGIPYFVARLFARERDAPRDLALGLVLAGVATMPLIAFEVITAKSISLLVYGLPVRSVYKYGIYSPVACMTNQLEMGMWMALAALVSFVLWCSRSEVTLRGVRFGRWASFAIVGSILCHQTGATGLLGGGIFLFSIIAGRERLGDLPARAAYVAVVAVAPKLGGRLSLIAILGVWLTIQLRNRRPRLLIYGLVAAAPLYVAVRTTGAVPRKSLTVAAYTLLGGERGYSLEYRMINEEKMMDHIMKRPFFGWATFEDKRARGGRDIILDGYWIILFALNGFAGLTAFLALLAFPQIIAMRRAPVDDWSDPGNAPVAALTLCIGLFGIDMLLNAYTSLPIIPLAAGTLVALPAGRQSRGASAPPAAFTDRGLDEVERLVMAGRPAEAEAACRRLIAVRSADPSGRASLADTYDRLADLVEASGRPAEAELPRRRAIGLREALLAETPGDVGLRAALAEGGERLARNLAGRGAFGPSAEARGRALELRAGLAASSPDDPETRATYADALNNLAWSLAMAPEQSDRDPERAVALAEQAVRIDPGRKPSWNTLGAAYYRVGDSASALAALRHSLRLGPDESGFDHALLALAYGAIGYDDAARDAKGHVDALLADGRPRPESLIRLREESDRTMARAITR